MEMNDYKNPPNPHHEAKFDAWRNYTEAYHNNAPRHILMHLYDWYEVASEQYEKNPQTIFN